MGRSTRCDFDRSDAIAQELHGLGARGDEPLARITGLASLGISRWHRGHVGEASALLDDACQAAADAAVPTATLGLDLEVVLLPYPFARYLHVLTGDLDEVAGEAEFEALARPPPTATRCRWCRCSPVPARSPPDGPNGPNGRLAGESMPTPRARSASGAGGSTVTWRRR